MDSLDNLKARIAEFAEERDWNQFHSPKNLSMALSAEAAELIEIFQWLTEAQSKELSEDKTLAAADEIADIQIYLIRIADKLGINILDAVESKIARNAAKYPVEKSRGNAKKYSEFD